MNIEGSCALLCLIIILLPLITLHICVWIPMINRLYPDTEIVIRVLIASGHSLMNTILSVLAVNLIIIPQLYLVESFIKYTQVKINYRSISIPFILATLLLYFSTKVLIYLDYLRYYYLVLVLSIFLFTFLYMTVVVPIYLIITHIRNKYYLEKVDV